MTAKLGRTCKRELEPELSARPMLWIQAICWRPTIALGRIQSFPLSMRAPTKRCIDRFLFIKDSLHVNSRIHKSLRSESLSYYVDTTVAHGLSSCKDSIPSPPGSANRTYRWVNTNCKGNADFDRYLTFVDLHEQCHLTRDSGAYVRGPDIPRQYQRVVGTSKITMRQNLTTELVRASDSILAYGIKLDNELYGPPDTSFRFIAFKQRISPTDTVWVDTTLLRRWPTGICT